MIVSWLLSRMQYGTGQLEVNALYERYKFESIEADLGEPVGLRLFIENLTAVFPKIKKSRKYVGQLRQTFYLDIILKPDVTAHKEVDFANISKCLQDENMKIECCSSDKISCQFPSGHFSNGTELVKTLTFFSDNSWTLSIAGIEISLTKLSIDSRYKLNKEGIHLVCNIAKQLKLCHGIQLSKSVITTRFHIIEQWKNDNTDDSSRILRSLSCLKSVPFTNQCNACIVCQNMTFRTNENKKIESLINEPTTTCKTKTITKDDFKQLIPSANEDMLDLLLDQANNCSKSSNGRRWNKKVISICLQLYSRSPHGYETLRNSNILILPSPQLLILYKNAVKQDVGFQNEVFEWMYEEACRKDMDEIGWTGGLIFDEMAIQADLQITKTGDTVELKGFVDMGDEANMCNTLRAGVKKQTLGTHVLQIVFLGLTGFRFPVAHFVTNQVQGPELFSLFWEAVDKIERRNFQVLYTCMDGAQCNRTFMHVNLDGIGDRSFIIPSFCSLRNMVFMMDFSHVAKKIRNNVSKSGIRKGSTRILKLESGLTVQWQMFVDAYEWDKQNCLAIHRKLSHEHLYPNSHEKMRNHLAEEVLNSDMLHLMGTFQSSLGEKGHELDGAIEFLGKTSQLVSFFRDMRPIKSMDDTRLLELRQICDWFNNWKVSADNSKAKDRYKNIMSLQCHEDIQACGIGFIELCQQVFHNQHRSITPGLVNSDAVENHFNQQRSTYHGANTNPSINQYSKAQNSIIVGQTSISRKANASRGKENTMPYGMLTNKPLNKKRNESRKSDCDILPKKIKTIRF